MAILTVRKFINLSDNVTNGNATSETPWIPDKRRKKYGLMRVRRRSRNFQFAQFNYGHVEEVNEVNNRWFHTLFNQVRNISHTRFTNFSALLLPSPSLPLNPTILVPCGKVPTTAYIVEPGDRFTTWAKCSSFVHWPPTQIALKFRGVFATRKHRSSTRHS